MQQNVAQLYTTSTGQEIVYAKLESKNRKFTNAEELIKCFYIFIIATNNNNNNNNNNK